MKFFIWKNKSICFWVKQKEKLGEFYSNMSKKKDFASYQKIKRPQYANEIIVRGERERSPQLSQIMLPSSPH